MRFTLGGRAATFHQHVTTQKVFVDFITSVITLAATGVPAGRRRRTCTSCAQGIGGLMSIVDRFKSWLAEGSSCSRGSFIEALESRKLMSITLSASVGEGGVNRDADVRQVQQRLRDLNFRAKGG